LRRWNSIWSGPTGSSHKIQLLVDKYGMDLVLEALQEEACRLTLDGDGKAKRVFNVLRVCREELEY